MKVDDLSKGKDKYCCKALYEYRQGYSNIDYGYDYHTKETRPFIYDSDTPNEETFINYCPFCGKKFKARKFREGSKHGI